MHITIDNIFPVPVVSTNLIREFNKTEIDFINSQRNQTYGNNGNLTSSNKYILREPEMGELHNFIECAIHSYVEHIIQPKHPVCFYVTQSWLNYTKPGGYHHNHSHANSLISGVLYINADKNKDKITFHNNNRQEQIIIEPSILNPYNSPNWWFSVSTGKLVLFPSELKHEVETTTSTEERISLAFNVWARGYLGDENNLTALHI